jgi:hypothetical protein
MPKEFRGVQMRCLEQVLTDESTHYLHPTTEVGYKTQPELPVLVNVKEL